HYIVRRNRILSSFFSNVRAFETVRVYLKPQYTVETFFSELNDRGVKYSVLRWFEELPLVKDGEDIDMLVLDKDFDLCMTYFTPFEIHG
ncbi:hypothetical protein, partial [Vibrio harveyi]|uniref:hypothetical protein n=1 Tax=Vibrio harveyi TaxID=669 RepID=UPI000AE9C642